MKAVLNGIAVHSAATNFPERKSKAGNRSNWEREKTERQEQARAHVAPLFTSGVGRTLIIFTCTAENYLLYLSSQIWLFVNPHQSLAKEMNKNRRKR